MKSPLEKLRKFALNKSEPKENWDHHISVHVDGLTQAAKDMKDMRTCYDSLLSAAAAAANSAYEFSESLLEMGDCLLEKTAVHDDGDTGGALSLLGRVQLDLQNLVDSYRSHIIMTITNPSESLLSELRKVEEMKLQCDEKREMFEYMVGQMREKGKSRHGKGESFTSQQLQAVCEEYDEAARLCIFRVESLKQGQCRSLLTQAARHHASQLDFFRKGLHSLEAVEPHIKSVAEKHRIDYALGELKDSERDEGNSFETNYEGELSFDYRRNNVELKDSYTSRNSMEVDQLGAAPDLQPPRIKDVEEQILSQQRRVSSHSAPIYAEKFDPAERIREMRTAVHKLNNNNNTHVLPTPADAKRSSLTSTTTASSSSKNLWHSSPLDVEKKKKILLDVEHNTTTPGYSSKPQIAAVEENINNNNDKHSHPLPRPLTEGGASVQQFETQSGFDTWKIKRQAFSGPLAGKPSVSNKLAVFHTSDPISLTTETHQSTTTSSGLLLSRVSASGNQQLLPPSSINVSQNSSSPPPPPLVSSPKISELHELPRPPPPDSLTSNKPMRSVTAALGHSAPLVVNRNQQEVPTKRTFKGGSPLPLPQLAVSRSFSIPSSSQRAMAYHSGQLMCTTEQVASPPLTPMSLSNIKSPNSGHIRGEMKYCSSTGSS